MKHRATINSKSSACLRWRFSQNSWNWIMCSNSNALQNVPFNVVFMITSLLSFSLKIICNFRRFMSSQFSQCVLSSQQIFVVFAEAPVSDRNRVNVMYLANLSPSSDCTPQNRRGWLLCQVGLLSPAHHRVASPSAVTFSFSSHKEMKMLNNLILTKRISAL